MITNSEFKELLNLIEKHKVRLSNGKPPLRVDIMMSIPGVEFERAWKNRVIVKLEGFDISFISRSDLIAAKTASGRPQDNIDVEKLKEAEQLD